MAALAVALMALSCGERGALMDRDRERPGENARDGPLEGARGRPDPASAGRLVARIDRLKSDALFLVITRRQGQISLMAVASATARQWDFRDICQGSDSTLIEVSLSNGKRLASPMVGDPRYEIVDERSGIYRRAVWRWAWHSLTDTGLGLADSLATVDSAVVRAIWRSRETGERFEKVASSGKVPVSLSRRKFD